MGVFIQVVNIFLSLEKEFEDSVALDAFFALFKVFNGHREIDHKLNKEIREFF
jgi:hypothetical protein